MAPIGDDELGVHWRHSIEAMVSEYLPAAQASHAADPTDALEVPAAQAWHVPFVVWVYPALH